MVEKIWAALGEEVNGKRPVIGLWSWNYGPLESLNPPASHVIDATDVTPKPAIDWIYDPETNTFSPPFIVPMIDRIPVVSTSNPSLSGVYPLNDRQYAFIAGVASQIANNRGVPGGGETFNFYDIDNQPHAFSAEEFLNFGQAISAFVSAALDAIHQAPGAQMPTVPITIP